MYPALFNEEKTTTGEITFAPLSDSGARPPQIHFELSDDRCKMSANPPGAIIRCSLQLDGSSCVHIVEASQKHIAVIKVYRELNGDDITTETIAIASAIYWSWWRAEDMHGRTHG